MEPASARRERHAHRRRAADDRGFVRGHVAVDRSALPIAIGSAIFVVEVAPRFGRKVFQPLVELLVGIPSVVYGLLGLTIIVAWTRNMGDLMGQNITDTAYSPASIVLAVMILPTVTSLSIDALAAVPAGYREGSYALGCTRWQTVWNVVLRSAAPRS